MIVVVRDERAPSWNGAYAGMHWRKRNALAQAAHLRVREALGDYAGSPFDCVVDITVVASYRKQPPDSDNVMDKIYIDGLRGLVIPDDDGRWVRNTTTRSELGSEDCVTITVTPVEEK